MSRSHLTRPSRRGRRPLLTRAAAVTAASVVLVTGAASVSTAASGRAVDLGARPVVLATVGSPGDSSTAAGAAARVGAPVLYTTSTTLSPSTRDFLAGYKATSVVVVGGDAAISPAVARHVDSLAGTVHRVAGQDKYETAAAVASFMSRVPAAGKLANGKSAYDLWREAGGKGDVTAFLASLRGPQGLTGKTGAQGPAGVAGPQGEVGKNGLPGEAGKDGEQGPAGPQGETGPQGPQGETGPAGPSAASTTRLAEFAFNRVEGDFEFTVSCAKDERAVGNGYRAMSGLVQVRDSYMYDNEFTFGGQVDRPVNLLLQVQCQQLDVEK